MNRLVKWLESGAWHSELFKMFILGSMFLGGVFFVKHQLPGLLDQWEDSRRIKAVSEARKKEYRENALMVEAAREELVNEHAHFCKETATTKESFLDCLAKVKLKGE